YRSMCVSSSEAKDQGFYEILEKVQNFYYDSFPNKIAYKRPVSVKEIRQKFRIYDATPAAKKNFTDKSRELLKEITELNIDRRKLSQRESKALSQVQHVLKYGLGYTYGVNYYTGDYMLPPNLWCEWFPICDIGHDLSESLRYFKPDKVEDLEVLRDRLITRGIPLEYMAREYGGEVQKAFIQYIENLKYGVSAGMVPPIEACKAGINGLTSRYKYIAHNGEQGVFNESYSKQIMNATFLSRFNLTEIRQWQEKYGKSVNESLQEFVLEYVGKPINNLFRYLREEHMLHCVPSTVSSGLASLPLSYVYNNGTADTTKPTTKRLPTGEVLDGKKTYERLIGSFTTNNMTPDAIYELGLEMLNKLYPETVELAKKATGKSENENDTAKMPGRTVLSGGKLYRGGLLMLQW
ncbi:hypothetical protein QZH41_017865, partial [Actinostola sp. cb2023]